MPNLGPMELIIILVIVLAIFGAGRLPELGGAIGRGIRDFRAAMREEDKDGKPEQSSGTQDAAS
ncbi:MAG: twin-arginine translocase TatA/TatE family subunit [Anaerolineae bacterium]|nr:twin-arginine translocase TatA/TatE family subunit [Anaerolineae bacterium]